MLNEEELFLIAVSPCELVVLKVNFPDENVKNTITLQNPVSTIIMLVSQEGSKTYTGLCERFRFKVCFAFQEPSIRSGSRRSGRRRLRPSVNYFLSYKPGLAPLLHF